jgi:hypothetical protein
MLVDAIEIGRKPRLNAIRVKRSVNLFTAAIFSDNSLGSSASTAGRMVATSSSDEIMSISSSFDILISSAGISLALLGESILSRGD